MKFHRIRFDFFEQLELNESKIFILFNFPLIDCIEILLVISSKKIMFKRIFLNLNDKFIYEIFDYERI